MDWWIEKFFTVRDVIAAPEYWLGIVTSVGLFVIHHRIKLPKIKVIGGGGSSPKLEDGETLGKHHITVYSNPYFLRYPVKREDLLVSSARIFDPKRRAYEGPAMRWHGAPENEPFGTTIQVGQSAGLYVCGVYKKRVHHYSGETLNNIELSETLVELGQSRKLEIHITDILTRRYKIPFRISAEERRNHFQKVQVTIRVKTTFADRLRQIEEGLRAIYSAFTRPSY